ncbi:hypothetical protein [Microcoleus sp. B9-D4]|uniref:hypothetical protein n=1 Tax=Microcoleus sp. B9-D4 TaxID=2818711 RepID=UPI002FD0EB7E
MATETYGQDETLAARGNQVSPIGGSDHSNGSQDIASTEGGDGSGKRQRRIRATVTRTDSAAISLSVSGKLARQLSKSLEAQLTESLSAHGLALADAAKYEQKISKLREELENLNGIIQELDEAERQIQERKADNELE